MGSTNVIEWVFIPNDGTYRKSVWVYVIAMSMGSNSYLRWVCIANVGLNEYIG